MKVILAARLAGRLTRGAGRHVATLVACVALGVAAVVAVGSLAASLEGTLAREARALLGGDLELRAARALPPEADAALADLVRAGARVVPVRELVAMARDPAGGASLLVEVKAVGPGYPLFGHLVASGPPAAGDGALVAREALDRLGLEVGGRLALGDRVFTVRGVIESEPDRPASLLALGPRVMIGADALDATGLVRLGSRVRHRALVALPPGQDAAAARAELARAIGDAGVRVTAYDEAQPGLRRFFGQLTSYLGLVGLASLLVGGVGVATAVSAFVARQVPTIAVLKALGIEERLLAGVFLLQTQALGVVGGLVGVALGVLAQPALAAALGGLVPFALELRPDPWTVARGLAMGSLATLLCTLPPLAEVRAVRPWLVLRREVAGIPVRRAIAWRPALPVAAALVGLALWQTSLTVAAIFLGASLAAVGLLLGLARALAAVARWLPRIPSPAWRQGVAALRKPGGHTPRVVVGLGMGAMVLVAVALLESALARQVDLERRREAPSLFFIDLQPDQRDGFARLVREAGGATAELTPVVRARLAAVDGEPITRETIDRRRRRGADGLWYFTREYVLTWADAPPAHNEVVRGRWWTVAEAAAGPRVSVEAAAARSLGIDLGSRLTFDVQGVPVEAEVTSIRDVDWQSLTTNFFMILSPGALDGAPATFVASARAPRGVETALQDAVSAAFPNVTAIPVRDVLERVAAVLGDIAAAVRLVGAFTLVAGLVVMAGALTATRSERLYESVVLRTLGADRAAVARAFAAEYACLGAVAGAGGAALAAVLAAAVLRLVLDVPWSLDPAPLALGLALTVTLAVVVGFLATYRLLGEKPLAVLRGE